MGSGKSSVGKALAEVLQFNFVDTDQLIVERAGKPITDIFAQEGEAAFRAWEARIVAELAEAHRQLVQEFRALVKAPFDASEHRRYLAKLAEHLEALRLHHEALRRRPP